LESFIKSKEKLVPQIEMCKQSLTKGSDYGYAWPDTIQIKGSVCHSNNVDLVA